MKSNLVVTSSPHHVGGGRRRRRRGIQGGKGKKIKCSIGGNKPPVSDRTIGTPVYERSKPVEPVSVKLEWQT